MTSGFTDQGFGLGKGQTGETMFVHASVVQDGEVLLVGTDAWAQVVSDDARAEEEGFRARRAWGRKAWTDERDKREGEQSGAASASNNTTNNKTYSAEEKVNKVCEQPPGLHDDGNFAQPQRPPVAQP